MLTIWKVTCTVVADLDSSVLMWNFSFAILHGVKSVARFKLIDIHMYVYWKHEPCGYKLVLSQRTPAQRFSPTEWATHTVNVLKWLTVSQVIAHVCIISRKMMRVCCRNNCRIQHVFTHGTQRAFLSGASQGSLAFVHISSMAVSRGSEPTELAKLVLCSASPLEMHTVCLFMHYVYRHTYIRFNAHCQINTNKPI